MTTQEFFKKYTKTIIIILALLFLFKSFQSCNRDMSITKLEKEVVHLEDSILQQRMMMLEDFGEKTNKLLNVIKERDFLIKDLNNELIIAGVKATEAQKRADAVQSTAEKVRKNTTIKIENNSPHDTISIK